MANEVIFNSFTSFYVDTLKTDYHLVTFVDNYYYIIKTFNTYLIFLLACIAFTDCITFTATFWFRHVIHYCILHIIYTKKLTPNLWLFWFIYYLWYFVTTCVSPFALNINTWDNTKYLPLRFCFVYTVYRFLCRHSSLCNYYLYSFRQWQ